MDAEFKSHGKGGNPMNTEKTVQEVFGEVIYAYTRKQAIADGYQVLLSGDYAGLARDIGWKYPVYLTRGVWDLAERAAASETDENDLSGVLWDILMVARFGDKITEDTRKFYVTLNTVGRHHRHLFYVQVGPTDIDDPAPSITIMLPEDR
jgi:hypothetical protein